MGGNTLPKYLCIEIPTLNINQTYGNYIMLQQKKKKKEKQVFKPSILLKSLQGEKDLVPPKIIHSYCANSDVGNEYMI